MRSKRLLFSIILSSVLGGAYAQVVDSTAQWTWMSGQSGLNDRGTSAGITVENNTNRPPARFNSCGWADKKGNLWLFGGDFNNYNMLNDMWRYSIAKNMWTWMNGSFNSGADAAFNVTANYNAKGVSGTSANHPGGRRGMTSFTDNAGKFWLFGGTRNPLTGGTPYDASLLFADLWKYDPDQNLWTYVSGATTTKYLGNYGTKGTGVAPPSANPTQPRSRGNAYTGGAGAAWADDAGNFWIFGGYGLNKAGTTPGYLNDLWRYNPSLDEWTWMGGSDETNQPGTYGAKGVEAPTNEPGGRYGMIYWKGKDGKFYMYGGTSIDGHKSDLWRFDPVTARWTWLQGSDQVRQVPEYGTRAAFAAANTPGGRIAAGMGDGWVDKEGKLWFFGGYGTTIVNTATSGRYEDLWCYDPALNQWAWMKGIPNRVAQNANYGTMGTTVATNQPGGRDTYAKWVDTSGNFWLLGGIVTSNSKADLWKLVSVAPPCVVTANVTVVRPVTFCAGDSVILIANAGTAYTYKWSNASGIISGATDDSLIVKTSGSYTVTVANGVCSKVSTATVATMNALPSIAITPATAVICMGKDTALTATNGVSYTWAPSGSGTSFRANPTTTTTYTVTGTDANGCKNTATRAVTVNSLPVISITPASAIICTGKDTALTASNGVSYTWLPNTFTGGGTTIRPNPTTTTTYTVTGTDANGCSNTATKLVTVNALPTVGITGNADLCPYSTVTLAGSPKVGGTWTSGTTSVAMVDNTGMVTGVVQGSSVVSYKFTDANGCTNTATKSVTVYTAPPMPGPIIGSRFLCLGESTTLTNATPNGVWSSGTTSVATISAAGSVTSNAAGTTLINYTISNGICITSISTNVTVYKLPAAPTAITGAANVCVGATVSLVSAPAYGMWTSSDVNTLTIQAANGMVTGVAAGNTIVKYTITDAHNCSSSTTRSMTVIANPVAVISPAGTVAFCEGDSISLIANSTPNMGYQWVKSGNIPGATAGTYTAKTAGHYKVIVIDGNNCMDTSATTTVVVYALPEPIVTRSGETLNVNTGYVSYQWYLSGNIINGAIQSSYIMTQDGSYYVVVTDSNGCSKASTIETITLGVANVTNGGTDVHIYPNPASSLVHIAASIPVRIAVIGVDGKLLMQQNDNRDIDVSNLASGIYIIKIMDKDGVFIKNEKLLKQ